MTIFAGVLSLDPTQRVPDAICAAVRQAISRTPGDVPVELSKGALFVAKVDIGAFGAPAWLQDNAGNLTAIAGEPLIDDGADNIDWNRGDDTAALHAAFAAEGADAALARCAGTFCGVHYDAMRARLTLFVDKVGVRPLYCWVGPDYVVFATALRILEALAFVDKQFDVRGVTEIAALSYPLAERTPYLNISMLRASETVTVQAGQVTRVVYWRWDGALDAAKPYADTVSACYAAFTRALRRRHRNNRIAAAFLSGGLDSRAIVGGLRAIDSDVHTVNYAPDETQDQVFATMAAERLGIHHTQLQTNADNVGQGYRKNAVRQWLREQSGELQSGVMWSGDGGSVALGHVYLTRPIIAALEAGRANAAVSIFNPGVPARVLASEKRASIGALMLSGAREELAAIDSADAGRAFHLFLMFNDQRRHLAAHFEDIDLDRIEFQLPFFDADFLATIVRLPSEPFLEHRFYMDWLALFPNGLTEVPWQAYPGHVPCLLPRPTLKYQWEGYYDKAMFRAMTRKTAQKGERVVRAKNFPSHLISRFNLRAATLLTRTGLRDYGYMINTADVYYRYWNICTTEAAAVN